MLAATAEGAMADAVSAAWRSDIPVAPATTRGVKLSRCSIMNMENISQPQPTCHGAHADPLKALQHAGITQRHATRPGTPQQRGRMHAAVLLRISQHLQGSVGGCVIALARGSHLRSNKMGKASRAPFQPLKDAIWP